MAKFNKEQFTWDGMYLMYRTDSDERQFIARFKYNKAYADFRNFLIKNFTVEEYVHRVAIDHEAPLKILESKGYVSPMRRKAMAAGLI